MIKVKLSEIKKPTTFEEFQENLKKYYFPYGDDCLYVKPQNGNADGIPYSKITSFSDIYKQTGSGFDGDGTAPSIIPLVEFQWESEEGEIVLYDCTTRKSRSELIDLPNLQWTSLDNGLLREIYAKTLGKFSGYISPDETETKEVA